MKPVKCLAAASLLAWAACTHAAATAQAQQPLLSASGSLPERTPPGPQSEGTHQDHPISLSAEQRILIDLTSTEFDPVVQLRRGEQLLAENDDFGEGLNSRLIYAVQEPGEYVVRVTSFWPGESGAYRLTVRPAQPLPTAETTAVTSMQRRWRLFRGALTDADERRAGASFDDYQIEMVQGQPVIILLDADNELFDPVVQVFRADQRDGEALASNDDGAPGFNSVLLFSPPESGSYVVRATSFGGDGRGTYQLRVGEAPPLRE